MATAREFFRSLTLARIAESAYQNWRLFVAGFAIAIVGLGAWMGYEWYQSQREREAGAALMKAYAEIRKHEAAKEREEAAIKQFRSVWEQHRGTRTGGEALVRLGNRFYENGKYDEAREAFANYLQEYSRGPLRMMAGIGRAYAEEAKGDLAAAERTLEAAVDTGKEDPLLGEAQIALARVYEGMKKTEAAMKVYGQVSEKFPQTRWAQYALDRMASLKVK